MGFCYDERKRLCCDFCGHSGGVRKIPCPVNYCQAYATCPACRKAGKHKQVDHAACRTAHQRNQDMLAALRIGFLPLTAEARVSRFDGTVTYWIDGEWYYPVCDLFNKTGLDMQEIEHLRKMGHTVTIRPERPDMDAQSSAPGIATESPLSNAT